MSPATVADIPLEDAEIVHVSGITPALSHSCAALIATVVDRVSAGRGILSFDVNHRAALWEPGVAAPTLLALARRADLVFVGLDEAYDLWGSVDADAVRELIPSPTQLVVKDGDVGATEFHRFANADVRSFAPAIETEVVEAVGAGDAFAAGYLAAQLQGADAGERLIAGHRRAHLVLQSTSDFLPDNL
jgi:2-dehydro-3-deoxygluconokinase